jgi:Domain of unknown function (DUF222)/HNH endonuclease
MPADSEHGPHRPGPGQVPDGEMAGLPDWDSQCPPGKLDREPRCAQEELDEDPGSAPGKLDREPHCAQEELDGDPHSLPGEPGWYPDDAYDDGSDQRAAFADGGWADAHAPDPLLATLVDLVQRDDLDKLDDDQLTGVLQAANRLAAWSASVRVAAVSGLAARREQSGRKSGDWRPFDHVDDEVAVALTVTRRSAARLLDLALGLDRLPLTRAALAAGLIDERRAEVIAEEVAGLDDEHAAAVEKLIIGRAPKLTSGQLRALVRRAVLAADPKAARRRKEKALQDARVEMFPETSGTAALAGRDLPPAGVLAADKHLTALAQAMKAAGQPGTLDILRARAYLHLLSGQPASALLPASATPADAGDGPLRGGAPDGTVTSPGAGTGFSPAAGPWAPGIPSTAGLRGTVNLTMPLSTWLGWTQSPGDVPGYGPVDAEDSRTVAALLARSRGNRWCVTLTDSGGRPVAHACARHGPPVPGQRASRASPATPVPDWLRGLTFTTLQTGDCTHPRQSGGYQPSPSLRHLIQVRNPTCTGPGCRRPATRCDLDHVIPYDRGGRTCECNVHPACRHDHRTKQAPGWTVTQSQPGTLTWTTPGNRTHTSTPAPYWA